MATIQTSIKLIDGMSPALRSINTALGKVLYSFDSLKQKMSQGLGGAGIQTTSVELGTVVKRLDEIVGALQDVNHNTRATTTATETLGYKMDAVGDEVREVVTGVDLIDDKIRQATVAQESFNTSTKKGESFMTGLYRKVRNLAMAYGGVQAIGGIIRTSDELTMTKARLNLMNDGTQTTEELMDRIFAASQRSRSDYFTTAAGVAKLGQRSSTLFKDNGETIQFFENLNKLYTIAGTAPQEIASATLQMSQALGSGVLRGEEFRAVYESAPIVITTLEKKLGIAEGQLVNLAKEGKVTSKVIAAAMLAATDEINEQFKKMPYTWAQIWTMMKNVVLKASQPILEAISNIIKSKRFAIFAKAVVNAFSRIVAVIRNVGKVAKPIFGWIFDTTVKIFRAVKKNWTLIAPIVWGVVGALTAYKVALMAIATWKGVVAAASAIKTGFLIAATAATWLATSATLAQAAAQWGLNASLIACPYVWVIAIIAAVIAAIYGIIAVINELCGTTYSATGLICAYFALVGTNIYNTIALVWNQIAIFAEFLYNVFVDPIYAIKALFVNLGVEFLNICIAMTSGWDQFATAFANAIIDAVKWAIQAWNDFISILPDKVANFLSIEKGKSLTHRVSITNDLVTAKDQLQASLGEKPEGYWTAPKMELMSYGQNALDSYDWGAEKANQAEKFVQGLNFKDLTGTKEREELMKKHGENNVDKYGNVADFADLNGIGGNTDLEKALKAAADPSNKTLKEIADGVGDINDTLSINDDERKYLISSAERQALHRAATQEIKIQMINNNSVKNESDVNKLIDKIRKMLSDEINASPEGLRL